MQRRSSSAPLLLLLALVPALWGFAPFRSLNRHVEQGNQRLKENQGKEALALYDRAAKELPDREDVQYNRGLALAKLGQLKDAEKAFFSATQARDASLRGKAYFNHGNIKFQLKQYKEAVASYIQALRLNPGWLLAKWNLELALRKAEEERKKQEEKEKKDQQKKDQQKKDQQDQQKKDKKQDQQKKDQQDQQKKDQQDQQKKDKKQDQQKQDQQKQDQQKQDQQKQDQQKKDQQQDQQQQKQQQKPEPAAPVQQEMNDDMNALDRRDRNMQRQRALMQGGGQRQRPRYDW